jgi:hypothetical protein
MRKIVVEAEVSVDGAMGGENTDFWKQVFPYHSPDVVEYLNLGVVALHYQTQRKE